MERNKAQEERGGGCRVAAVMSHPAPWKQAGMVAAADWVGRSDFTWMITR